jgi:hypothetical protein
MARKEGKSHTRPRVREEEREEEEEEKEYVCRRMA